MTTAHASVRAEIPVDATVKTFGEWLKRFISHKAVDRLERAHSNATVALLRNAIAVLDELGLDDAITAVFDSTAVFTDLQRRPEDLHRLAEAVLRSETLYEPFVELRLVTGSEDDAFARLAVVRILPGPPGDPPQLRFDVASRSRRLRARPGDRVEAFRDRVLAWAGDTEAIESLVADARRLATEFAERIDGRIDAAHVRVDDGGLRIVALGPTEAARLRHLGFGKFVRAPTYRASPSYSRRPPNDGPFDYYVFDPYDALAREWLVDAMSGGALRHPDVTLVSSDGTPFAGAAIDAAAFERLGVPRGSVRIDRGALVVDAAIPEVSALDPAEALSEHAPGYGGRGDG